MRLFLRGTIILMRQKVLRKIVPAIVAVVIIAAGYTIIIGKFSVGKIAGAKIFTHKDAHFTFEIPKGWEVKDVSYEHHRSVCYYEPRTPGCKKTFMVTLGKIGDPRWLIQINPRQCLAEFRLDLADQNILCLLSGEEEVKTALPFITETFRVTKD